MGTTIKFWQVSRHYQDMALGDFLALSNASTKKQLLTRYGKIC
jgi:hypothetical protein